MHNGDWLVVAAMVATTLVWGAGEMKSPTPKHETSLDDILREQQNVIARLESQLSRPPEPPGATNVVSPSYFCVGGSTCTMSSTTSTTGSLFMPMYAVSSGYLPWTANITMGGN